ncbi:hypothetical protein MYCTH_2052653 [Thermothelomyces thermophilus ATCC 42464]|uniref:Uncharacterized protein n=1 Tax=Thermothelomyces thermophilus (strain ATCC 42464 / BCRC 31852 / DSM 1799) TaxID=573729 RepID=G2Q310_THET4|nr:uncharacterized protein MYCTH_2052653 [Thermothelomyces thermophilus ATCC 42464]AEO55177.1 hypothetical protein MYCTH_2052653 [Thermothelomyces thermophilus ATCC 42464]
MSQPLFGLVPAGQPVIVTPTQTPTPTSFLYAIPPTPPGVNSKPFSHIVVFLLPGITLPPGTAAAIYLVTPDSQTQEPNTKFLGGIGPGKESAIFKLSPPTNAAAAGAESNVVIGVSVEPAESVSARIAELSGALVPASRPAMGQQPSTLVLAQRIIKNAFNFLASFSGNAGQPEMVPLKAFEEWWRKFEGKVRSDPGFLERDE